MQLCREGEITWLFQGRGVLIKREEWNGASLAIIALIAAGSLALATLLQISSN